MIFSALQRAGQLCDRAGFVSVFTRPAPLSAAAALATTSHAAAAVLALSRKRRRIDPASVVFGGVWLAPGTAGRSDEGGWAYMRADG